MPSSVRFTALTCMVVLLFSIRAGPLDCFGSVTVDSQKRRSVHSNVRLKRLSADSKSGAVGGLVNVQMAETASKRAFMTCVTLKRHFVS